MPDSPATSLAPRKHLDSTRKMHPGGESVLQVEPRGIVGDARSSNGMNIAFTEQHISLAPQFNFPAIFGFVKNAIADGKGAHVGSCCDNLGPDQAAPDFGRCRNHNSTGRTSLTIRPIGLDKHTIVQEFDRQRRLIRCPGTHDYLVLVENAALDPAKHDEADDDANRDCHPLGANTAVFVDVEGANLGDLNREDALGVKRLLYRNLQLGDVLHEVFARRGDVGFDLSDAAHWRGCWLLRVGGIGWALVCAGHGRKTTGSVAGEAIRSGVGDFLLLWMRKDLNPGV